MDPNNPTEVKMTVEATVEPTNLQSIYQNLCEINVQLDSPIDQLRFTIEGKPSDPTPSPNTADLKTPGVTLQMILDMVHEVGRKSSTIQRFTNQMVGN